MTPVTISFINASTAVSDADLGPVAAALQTQVSRDFAPFWGQDAVVVPVLKGKKAKPGTWQLVVLDDSDQADALGYHDVTRAGQPLGKVFAHSDIKAGYTWSVTASHELLEMLADPSIDLTVFDQTSTGGTLYSVEVCDACEADHFGYLIDGVLVSDFVTPAWFQRLPHPKGTRFDFGGHLGKPLELLAGGYMGYYPVAGGAGWQQRFAESTPRASLRPHRGSRRERRRVGREAWQRSTR